MLASASENCVLNVEICFVIFVRFFVVRMSTSALENCIADVDIRFVIFF